MKKIIKFEKEDCNPCALVSEYLDKKEITYEKINPFNSPEMAMKYKVRSVPTVILLEDDEEKDRTVGYKIDELEALIEKL